MGETRRFMFQKFPHLIQKYFFLYTFTRASRLSSTKNDLHTLNLFPSSPFHPFQLILLFTTISIHFLFYLKDKLENFLHSQHHHYNVYWEWMNWMPFYVCALLNIIRQKKKIIIIILYKSSVCRENMQMLSLFRFITFYYASWFSFINQISFEFSCENIFYFTIEKLSDWGRVFVYSSLISIMNLQKKNLCWFYNNFNMTVW